MTRRHLILSAIVMALCAGVFLRPHYNLTYGDDVWRGAALIADALGAVPLKVARLMAVFMAVHYLLELPKLVRRARFHWAKATRIHWANAKGIVTRFFCGAHIVIGMSVKVAIPVMFYAVFSGGHNTSNIHVLTGYMIAA